MHWANPFTDHPQKQGVSYLEHWCFAMGIARRLLSSATAFALHALLPSIPVARRLDLEATADYLLRRNHWIESAKQASRHAGLLRNTRARRHSEELEALW